VNDNQAVFSPTSEDHGTADFPKYKRGMDILLMDRSELFIESGNRPPKFSAQDYLKA